MNIFRILGDLCHYTAIITIFAKIIASKSCMGISGRYREVHFFCPENSSLTIFYYECLQNFFYKYLHTNFFPQVTDSLPPCLPHEVHGRVHPLHLVVQHLDQDLLHHLHHDQHLPGLCQIRRDNLIRYGHIQVQITVKIE